MHQPPPPPPPPALPERWCDLQDGGGGGESPFGFVSSFTPWFCRTAAALTVGGVFVTAAGAGCNSLQQQQIKLLRKQQTVFRYYYYYYYYYQPNWVLLLRTTPRQNCFLSKRLWPIGLIKMSNLVIIMCRSKAVLPEVSSLASVSTSSFTNPPPSRPLAASVSFCASLLSLTAPFRFYVAFTLCQHATDTIVLEIHKAEGVLNVCEAN